MFPRQLDDQGQSLLSSFAGMAARQLEQASAASKRIQENYISGHAAALGNAIHGFSEPMMLCDISKQQHWRVAAVNQAWLDATGICRLAHMSSSHWLGYAAHWLGYAAHWLGYAAHKDACLQDIGLFPTVVADKSYKVKLC